MFRVGIGFVRSNIVSAMKEYQLKVDFAFECADQDLAHGRQHMRGKLFPSELTTAFEFLAPTLQAGDGKAPILVGRGA